MAPQQGRPSGLRDTVAESRERDQQRRQAETEHARSEPGAGEGRVVVSNRFAPGDRVRLFEVAGPWVLRSAAGREVEGKTVDEDGNVEFTGLDPDRRYFVRGISGGEPVEVRATPDLSGDAEPVLAQPAIGYDRQKLADGRFVDELPGGPRHDSDRHAVRVGEAADEVGLATGEMAPYPSQEVVGEGVQQRSNTPLGAATPIPAGDAVGIEAAKQSSPQGKLPASGAQRPSVAGDTEGTRQTEQSGQSKQSTGKGSES